jgi:hypothetical protein
VVLDIEFNGKKKAAFGLIRPVGFIIRSDRRIQPPDGCFPLPATRAAPYNPLSRNSIYGLCRRAWNVRLYQTIVKQVLDAGARGDGLSHAAWDIARTAPESQV